MENKKRPFFARFLENQVSEDKMEGTSGGATSKYPSDTDESILGDMLKEKQDIVVKATNKYPSDSDETVTMKYPSDHDEHMEM